MDYNDILSSCYCGDASGKLQFAVSLERDFGQELLQQDRVVSQIEILQKAVISLDTHMESMNMGKTCSQCAATPKGGCCSAYMGNENNDSLQLFMNILAGVDVKQVCNNNVECCFLSERGCILLFKPIFCLNYLCRRIQKKSSNEELNCLEHKAGFLLGVQVELERFLIRFLQRQVI